MDDGVSEVNGTAKGGEDEPYILQMKLINVLVTVTTVYKINSNILWGNLITVCLLLKQWANHLKHLLS